MYCGIDIEVQSTRFMNQNKRNSINIIYHVRKREEEISRCKSAISPKLNYQILIPPLFILAFFLGRPFESLASVDETMREFLFLPRRGIGIGSANRVAPSSGVLFGLIVDGAVLRLLRRCSSSPDSISRFIAAKIVRNLRGEFSMV